MFYLRVWIGQYVGPAIKGDVRRLIGRVSSHLGEYGGRGSIETEVRIAGSLEFFQFTRLLFLYTYQAGLEKHAAR